MRTFEGKEFAVNFAVNTALYTLAAMLILPALNIVAEMLQGNALSINFGLCAIISLALGLLQAVYLGAKYYFSHSKTHSFA